MIFSAGAAPIRRGSRCVPPAPGSSPSFTSGKPSRAAGAAMRAWQPSASSSPPPSAAPLIAATTGLRSPSIPSITSGSIGGTGGLPNSVMSAPPEKVRPSAAITIAVTPESASARRSASASAVRTAAPSALTGGLTMRSTATPSATA